MTEGLSREAHGSDVPPRRKGLKKGALGFLSNLVIGIAATAPGYSLAAVLGFVAAAVGPQTPAVLVLAFLPMLCIAAAYYYLNRTDPDCGTTFSWATRAFGPWAGWMGGWGILVSGVLVQANLAQIAGRYSLLLVGLDRAANDAFTVALLGVGWIALMTWVCLIGIEVSARVQWFLLAMELFILLVFAVLALVRVYGAPQPVGIEPAWSWLDPFEIRSADALAAGVLLALFIYWGWDNSVSVNEESRNPDRGPGRAAVASTVILAGTYVLVAVSAQTYGGPEFLAENRDDVLSVLGEAVLGPPLDRLMVVAVLTSAAAAAQATLLATARTSLSMAARGALPVRFARIHPRYLTPSTSTIWGGALSILWYVGLTGVSEDILYDGVLSLGLVIAFYYGLTGYACPVVYRREVGKSAKNFLLIGVAPFLGGLVLTWAFVKSSIDLADPANSTRGEAWLGIGPPLVIGLGFLGLGAILMLLMRRASPKFFQQRAADDERVRLHSTGRAR